MKKFSIKDIFSEEIKTSDVKNVESVKENRMTDLMKSFEQKGEIVKEIKTKKVNQKKINQEKERNKKYAGLNEWGSVNQFNGIPTVNGLNPNVMAFVDKKETVNTFMDADNNNPNSMKPYNPNYAPIQAGEGLRLAISRTLNSGAPINGIGFYEEINQILTGLGLGAKNALDIKQAVLKMMK